MRHARHARRRARPRELLNLPVADRALACAQLDAGVPVWVGIDWSNGQSCEHGLLDVGMYDYSPLGLAELDKGVELSCRLRAEHAVLLVGYQPDDDDDDRVDRWRVENSHGTMDACYVGKGHYPAQETAGHLTMTDAWFERYVFELVVLRRLLTPAQRAALARPAKEVDAWDAEMCALMTGGEA